MRETDSQDIGRRIGPWHGRTVKFGECVGPDLQSIHVHLGERRTIETMRRMQARGMSANEISDTLTLMEVRTKKGGRHWLTNTVATILRREDERGNVSTDQNCNRVQGPPRVE